MGLILTCLVDNCLNQDLQDFKIYRILGWLIVNSQFLIDYLPTKSG